MRTIGILYPENKKVVCEPVVETSETKKIKHGNTVKKTTKTVKTTKED